MFLSSSDAVVMEVIDVLRFIMMFCWHMTAECGDVSDWKSAAGTYKSPVKYAGMIGGNCAIIMRFPEISGWIATLETVDFGSFTLIN